MSEFNEFENEEIIENDETNEPEISDDGDGHMSKKSKIILSVVCAVIVLITCFVCVYFAKGSASIFTSWLSKSTTSSTTSTTKFSEYANSDNTDSNVDFNATDPTSDSSQTVNTLSPSGSRAPNNSNNADFGDRNNTNPSTKKTTTTPTTTEVVKQWQRKYGFNEGYDKLSALALMNICTVRFKFDYNNIHWMIQLWKGEYVLATVGAEIGVYFNTDMNTALEDVYQFSSEDETGKIDNTLKMSMKLYLIDSKGERQISTCPYKSYWWMTTFVEGSLEKHSRRSDLVAVSRITFPNSAMRDAFLKSMDKKNFKKVNSVAYTNADSYSVSGNDVNISWRYLEEKK